MTATLVFGGTFDPVHNGHLSSARDLLALIEGARVVLIPCQIPAHRPVPATPAADRYAMLQLATEGLEAIATDDCELRREGVSYSFDTLSEYRARIGDAPLFFVMGRDAWLTLPTWHRWRELCDVAHLLVIERPGVAAEAGSELSTWARHKTSDLAMALRSPAGCIVFETLAQHDVSATQIRDRRMRGDSIADLVPAAVDRYISARHLYL
jgi:nicotinate-nucleotide adenylyltransferase